MDTDEQLRCRATGPDPRAAAGLNTAGRTIGDVPTPVAVEDSIALLERTPRVLHALLAGLPDRWLAERDTPDGWQARDVVGHLITGELTDWIPRAEIILHDGTSRPFDPFDRFEMLERDRGVPLDELIERFASLRTASIARLREIVTDETDLDRRGTHPSLGEVTLGQLIACWAVHDLDHVAQVHAALAGSRDADVGPWREYLGILVRREATA
jgi:hypothetical protein